MKPVLNLCLLKKNSCLLAMIPAGDDCMTESSLLSRFRCSDEIDT